MIRSLAQLAMRNSLPRFFARTLGKKPLSDGQPRKRQSTPSETIERTIAPIEDEEDLYVVPPEARAARVKPSDITPEVVETHQVHGSREEDERNRY